MEEMLTFKIKRSTFNTFKALFKVSVFLVLVLVLTAIQDSVLAARSLADLGGFRFTAVVSQSQTAVQAASFLAPLAGNYGPPYQNLDEAKCKLVFLDASVSYGNTFTACWNFPPLANVHLVINNDVVLEPIDIFYRDEMVCGTFSLFSGLQALLPPGTHSVECQGPGGTADEGQALITVTQ